MKKTIITLVVIAAIAASVGGYYYTRPGPEPKVTTSAVSRGDITEVVASTGTLDAVTAVTVGSQVGGIIQELGADFNSIVKRGQVLLKINPDNINTQIEQAKATLVQRQADLERNKVSLEDAVLKQKRTKGLFDKKLATQADMDSADVAVKSADASLKSSQASLTQAQANLEQQNVNLAHTIITSPIDGIVIQRAVDVGQTVQANYQSPTLFIVAADLTKMKCTANIDESEVGKIRPGQTARLRFDAYPNESFYGKVIQVRLQPITVQNVVSYGTVIEVPNLDYKLKPGMTANVQIEINKKTDVIRVPATAVRFRPTEDIFAAFNQPVPPELLQMQRGMRGGNRGDMAGGMGMGMAPGGASSGQPGQAPRAGQPGVPAAPAPQAGQPSASPSERGGGDRPAANAAPGGPRPGAGEGRPFGPGGMPGGMPGAMPGGGFGQRGEGGQRRPFDPNDPEVRARMVERYQSMPADRKAEFASRMKERGMDIEAWAKGAKPAAGGATAKGDAAPSMGGATTIDALFGPLTTRTTMGRAWLWLASEKKLKSIRLRLGITDGQFYELLEGEGLKDGTELVTAVTLGNESGNRGGTNNSNPLMQNRGMMGPPGGFGGPGGGRR